MASQIRIALANKALKTGSSSPGELDMTRNTSVVAACCSSASSRSRLYSATCSLTLAAGDRRWRVDFGALPPLGAAALRLRALVGFLLALERRRIAHPKGLGLRRFSKSITAGICAQRNGVQDQFARWEPKSSADAATSAKWGAPREDIQNARRVIGQGQGCIDRLDHDHWRLASALACRRPECTEESLLAKADMIPPLKIHR